VTQDQPAALPVKAASPKTLKAMNSPAITSATKPVEPELAELLKSLKPGQRIRVTQRVRVGHRVWPAVVEGVFRDLDFLATGLATDRVREDDIVVPVVHFIKANGELSSITIDEHTRVEKI
jgi:hypothetical protein